jgi:acetolactate synthase-1/2/3 large subunit
MARRKKTITGAELFCRSLVEEGVTYLFGYTGGAIMPVYDAFPKFPKLTHIMVRHEQAAAFATNRRRRSPPREWRVRRGSPGYASPPRDPAQPT